MATQIKNGKAPKPIQRRTKYKFEKIMPGMHMVLPKEDRPNENSIRACASAFQVKTGIKLSVSKQNNGDITVERTK